MHFKNRHIIMLFSALVLLLNLSTMHSIVKLWYLFIILLFTSTKDIISVINFQVLDILFSVVIILGFVLCALFVKWKVLDRRVSLLSFFSVLLIYFFTIPSLITDTPPEYYSNIKITKLLPPFSSVFYSRPVSNIKKDNLTSFLEIKDEMLRSNFQNAGFYDDKESKGYITEKKMFLLGTDEYGRDIASRVIYGTRISLVTGLLAVCVSLFLGLVLGFISGYSGGFTDILLNRIVEMLLSFPAIFLVILFAALFGSSLFSIILLLGFTGWMTLFKVVRGELLLLKNKDFFVSSRLVGGNIILLMKESLPFISASLMLTLIFQFSNVILAESALSYLGLGTGISYPSWGSMIQEGQSYIYKAWWMIIIPGTFLILTLSIINTLGRSFDK